ncbi:MAG: hypothetical protein IPK74_39635 [Deltaproteobacteria bacterium]|nr:hypothetical protein [Deltaproteobacteria bacterium]
MALHEPKHAGEPLPDHGQRREVCIVRSPAIAIGAFVIEQHHRLPRLASAFSADIFADRRRKSRPDTQSRMYGFHTSHHHHPLAHREITLVIGSLSGCVV